MSEPMIWLALALVAVHTGAWTFLAWRRGYRAGRRDGYARGLKDAPRVVMERNPRRR